MPFFFKSGHFHYDNRILNLNHLNNSRISPFPISCCCVSSSFLNVNSLGPQLLFIHLFEDDIVLLVQELPGEITVVFVFVAMDDEFVAFRELFVA